MGAPCLQRRDLKTPEGLGVIASARCDIAVSMNWLDLLPQAVRDLFPLGVFNAHPGDLPRFKGNACPNWAILMCEKRVALSVHAMTDALDAGPIADKSYLELGDDVDISDVYDWLRQSVPAAFRRVVAKASEGSLLLAPQPHDPTQGLRCYPRRPEDSRIDWASPVADVLRLVRASGRPFSGAFTSLEGKRRLTIWRARFEPLIEPFVAVPGQIAYVAEHDPVIAGLDGYLRLVDITLDGLSTVSEAKSAVLSSLRNRLI
jgi:methionyl-tRNA formyltransferase